MEGPTSTLPTARAMRAMRAWRAAAILLAAVVASGCSTVQTTAPGAVGVDRKQRMIVSEEQVREGAAAAYAQELEKAKAANKLNTDRALVTRVRGVSDRLIPHTATFRPDAPKWAWEVNVQSSPELNAYVMPGGKIMVYSGLVEKLKLSDAELASVIGHEMAHALREHTRERVSRAYAQQLVLGSVAAIAGMGQGTLELANMVGSVTFQLPHGREQESEADVIGLELMARAGYDPNASVSVWRKMGAENRGGPPEFLSTHPAGENRIRELEARIPAVLPLYQAARR